ncbi:E3 ubiquitin-protein ligase RNF181-like protein [Cucumis melo var. makuwa]|uniref:E3 ubiquitin-protein ligase RNF181-like protein n=1 Tax=Cucumis melo var. makuwa TaxID=1194695 RepID=A0A5D3D7E9_CUCMM|nr:E3 ubiquitin-protein ligase RNF181-like protein [Cucumis melo var. makuwa]
MTLDGASTFRYSIRRKEGSIQQSLQIRLGRVVSLLSRPPSAGLPYEILKETSSISIQEATFPLPLRDLEDSCLCEIYIVQLLSSFNLGTVTSGIISRKITSMVVEVLAAGDYDTKFQIVAEIDHIQMYFWGEEEERSWVGRGNNNSGIRRGVVVEERVVLEGVPARRRAAAEREEKGGFDERGDQLGDCCVCREELRK